MATPKSRAALDAWLAQVEEVLQGAQEPATGQNQDEDVFEHGDAA